MAGITASCRVIAKEQLSHLNHIHESILFPLQELQAKLRLLEQLWLEPSNNFKLQLGHLKALTLPSASIRILCLSNACCLDIVYSLLLLRLQHHRSSKRRQFSDLEACMWDEEHFIDNHKPSCAVHVGIQSQRLEHFSFKAGRSCKHEAWAGITSHASCMMLVSIA